MATYYLKQNDRAPTITATLKNPDGTVYDLSTSNGVDIRVLKQNSETPIVDGKVATVTDAAGGVVEYTFADGETDTPGFFLVEWIVDVGFASEQKFPNYGFDGLYIERKL